MTLEGCLIFDPHVYLENRKCRDLAEVARERLGMGVVVGFNRLLIVWLQAQTLYHTPLTSV